MKRMKHGIQTFEATLLGVACETNWLPPQNATSGTFAKLILLLERHGVIKVFVGGYDPLQNPAKGKPLGQKKVASIQCSRDAEILIDQSWRSRLLRQESLSNPHALYAGADIFKNPKSSPTLS